MDVWIDGWVDDTVDCGLNVNKWMDIRWRNGQGGWMDEWMEGWTGGQY